MAFIIKLIYGDKINEQIARSSQNDIFVASKLTSSVDLLFQRMGWSESDFLARFKRSAVKSLLKERISEIKARQLPILLREITSATPGKFRAFHSYEIDYIRQQSPLQNLSSVNPIQFLKQAKPIAN